MGFLSVIIFSIFLATSSTEAYNFIVGGKNGWSSHPSEDYKQWSGRMRFSINDTLCKFLYFSFCFVLYKFRNFIRA